MISETELTLKSELQDLAQPQRELTPEEAAQVEGGFNPQPEPPGFVMNPSVQFSTPVIVMPPQTNVRQGP